jgi:hypothetical protein
MDGLDFPSAADLPAGVLESLQNADTVSLSSGVESLPSGCSSASEQPAAIRPDFTDYTEYTGPVRNNDRSKILRERSKAIDYVGHPMDAAVGRPGRLAQSALADQGREFRGRSTLPELELTLPASDGKKGESPATWPTHGPNTMRGRMVSCLFKPFFPKLTYSKKCPVTR